MWFNTNKLLSKGFNGLKTGITSTAGPCLASSFKSGNFFLIFVVLSCKTPDHRWHEMVKLKDYAIQLSDLTKGKTPQSPDLKASKKKQISSIYSKSP
jgi:D-alanyl-D-alanine carboxypeptidase